MWTSISTGKRISAVRMTVISVRALYTLLRSRIQSVFLAIWNRGLIIYHLRTIVLSISRIQELSICYKLVPQLDNDTIATAAPLTERVWQDVWQAGYFSIGERKAGEVVQIQYDNRGSKPKEFIHVYDADGKEISSSYRANLNFRIPTDGVYYLKAPECDVNVNAENEPMHLAHIRYYTHNDKIGAVESVTMRPNESVFLDLWFSPDVSFSDKSEAENLTYNWSTGYLTAPNTPEGSADLVFSNGYPEGDERRIEAVVACYLVGKAAVRYFNFQCAAVPSPSAAPCNAGSNCRL